MEKYLYDPEVERQKLYLPSVEGGSMELAGSEWPLSEIVRVLLRHACPRIKERVESELRDRNPVTFREPRGRALMAMIGFFVFTGDGSNRTEATETDRMGTLRRYGRQ